MKAHKQLPVFAPYSSIGLMPLAPISGQYEIMASAKCRDEIRFDRAQDFIGKLPVAYRAGKGYRSHHLCDHRQRRSPLRCLAPAGCEFRHQLNEGLEAFRENPPHRLSLPGGLGTERARAAILLLQPKRIRRFEVTRLTAQRPPGWRRKASLTLSNIAPQVHFAGAPAAMRKNALAEAATDANAQTIAENQPLGVDRLH